MLAAGYSAAGEPSLARRTEAHTHVVGLDLCAPFLGPRDGGAWAMSLAGLPGVPFD